MALKEIPTIKLSEFGESADWINRMEFLYPKMSTAICMFALTEHLDDDMLVHSLINNVLQHFCGGQELNKQAVRRDFGLVLEAVNLLTDNMELSMPAEVMLVVVQATAEVDELAGGDSDKLNEFKRKMNAKMAELGDEEPDFAEYELPFIDLSGTCFTEGSE